MALADALAGIGRDPEFGAIFAGVWIDREGDPRVMLALKGLPDTEDTVHALTPKFPELTDPRVSVRAVVHSLAELEILHARFLEPLQTRSDLRAVVVSSGVFVQGNRFLICVLSSTAPEQRESIQAEFGGAAVMIAESPTRWSTMPAAPLPGRDAGAQSVDERPAVPGAGRGGGHRSDRGARGLGNRDARGRTDRAHSGLIGPAEGQRAGDLPDCQRNQG